MKNLHFNICSAHLHCTQKWMFFFELLWRTNYYDYRAPDFPCRHKKAVSSFRLRTILYNSDFMFVGAPPRKWNVIKEVYTLHIYIFEYVPWFFLSLNCLSRQSSIFGVHEYNNNDYSLFGVLPITKPFLVV